jgi:tight adherence protein C
MLTAIVLGSLVLIAGALVYAGMRLPASGDPLETRLAEYAGRDKPITLEEIELQQPFQERVLLPMLRGIGQLVMKFTPKANLVIIHQKLEMAGNPTGLDPTIFWALQIVAAAVRAHLVLFLSPGAPSGSWRCSWWRSRWAILPAPVA